LAGRFVLDGARFSVAGAQAETLDAGGAKRVREGALRTLVNTGVLGPGEQRRRFAERYPFDVFPAAAALVAHRRPYLFGSGVFGDFASASLEARLEKNSQAAVPLLVGGRVWGELWVASTRGGPSARA
jgi:hypothetical protein